MFPSFSDTKSPKGSILIPYNIPVIRVKMNVISGIRQANINKSKTMKPEQKLLNLLIFSRNRCENPHSLILLSISLVIAKVPVLLKLFHACLLSSGSSKSLFSIIFFIAAISKILNPNALSLLIFAKRSPSSSSLIS